MPQRPLTVEEKKRLQERLRDEGFYKGEIDGRLGELSSAAIEAAKSKEGVTTLQQLVERWKIMDTVEVPVKSAWSSKINWQAMLGLVFTLVTWFGVPLDEETKANIIALVNSALFVGIWISKTFFTTSVTKASANKV